MKARIFSGVILGLVLVPSILWFEKIYYALMCFIGIMMLQEWFNISKARFKYLLIGTILISVCASFLCMIRYVSYNYSLTLLYFTIIWSVDIFALIGGKLLEGPLLAPNISPKKTWSGLAVGAVSASIITKIITFLPCFSFAPSIFIKPNLFIVAFSLSILSQCSDIMISWFKRKFNVKDSGKTIPGHGGFLDRFDGMILTAPVMFLLIII